MPVDTEQPKYISLAIAEQEAAIKKEGKGDGCCAILFALYDGHLWIE